jgi:hypothetical protein
LKSKTFFYISNKKANKNRNLVVAAKVYRKELSRRSIISTGSGEVKARLNAKKAVRFAKDSPRGKIFRTFCALRAKLFTSEKVFIEVVYCCFTVLYVHVNTMKSHIV